MVYTVKGYVPALDGLRAFAILGVLGVHVGMPGFQSGWVGVDLFFAISGFLITSLLMQELGETGDVQLGSFWGRRALRLMPAYVLYVGGITIAMWTASPEHRTPHGGWTPLEFTAALWLYFVNYAPWGGIWTGQDLTIHLWSLAVEEQYYLMWPLILAACRRRPALLEALSWALYVCVTAYFILTPSNEQRSALLYTRGMPLFLASAVAVSLHRHAGRPWLSRVLGGSSVPLCASICTILVFFLGATGWPEALIRRTALPILAPLYVLLILWVVQPRPSLGRSLLAYPVLVQIGRVSYGIYLYHELVRIGVWEWTHSALSTLPRYLAYGVRLSLYLLGSFAIAWVSYRLIETPFLRLKRHLRGKAGPKAETATVSIGASA
jgi:peptidoglycan/LPS O-acetylase OafA/YrhL